MNSVSILMEGSKCLVIFSSNQPTREVTYSSIAEAMVEVMEFLAPNQLHTVSAYLEFQAEKDEKASFTARFGA